MEKRKVNRVDFDNVAKVYQNDKIIEGRIGNLSMKGFFIVTDEKLKLNSEVNIEIILSGTSTELAIKIKGTVVRAEENGFGIDFKEMELDSFIHLRNVVFYADHELHEYYEFI